jgi:hypothetical protein
VANVGLRVLRHDQSSNSETVWRSHLKTHSSSPIAFLHTLDRGPIRRGAAFFGAVAETARQRIQADPAHIRVLKINEGEGK